MCVCVCVAMIVDREGKGREGRRKGIKTKKMREMEEMVANKKK